MRRYMPFLIALLCLLMMTTATADTRIMVVSDLHWMAPELYQGSDLLTRSISGGDGKVSDRTVEMADGLVAEILHQQPDAVVLTGDITFNGELASTHYVADRMAEVTAAGIPVCVIPGNHDLGAFVCYDYSGETYIPVATTDPADFQRICGGLMPGEPAPEGSGFSYLYPVNDSVWLMMLDTCWYEDSQAAGGWLRPTILPWAEEVFTRAEAAGAQVITATHQSLTAHAEYQASHFSVMNGEALERLMAAHGMKLNLSGHSHIQHILTANGIVDAALGAHCMAPHLYAMVTVADDGSIVYDARPVCEEHYPDGFTQENRETFIRISSSKMQGLEPITGDRAEACARLLGTIHYASFSGTLHSAVAAVSEDPDWQLLQAHAGEISHVAYFLSRFAEEPEEMLHIEIR